MRKRYGHSVGSKPLSVMVRNRPFDLVVIVSAAQGDDGSYWPENIWSDSRAGLIVILLSRVK
ncbi:hypothetical protein PSPTOT1_3557 [Pseudomonas syringae pv. tomato T1]|nr:hypothetical protein PSPTOT1_3557 [Pseudomonas syringae pv. tomato T1]